MSHKNIFQVFHDAISNEISIEKDILKRLNKSNLSFRPLRAIKTLPYIEKYHINKFIYSFICIFFVILSPIYFIFKLFKHIKFNNNTQKIDTSNNLVLIANGRVEYLYDKLKEEKENTTFININQTKKSSIIHIHNLLNFSDYLKAYLYSIINTLYILFKLKNKTDILQVYVAYEWFLTYVALSKIQNKNKNIYFANHYDRWATLFDQLFKGNRLILLQHGILPDELELHYKLKNIDIIYTLNKKSIDIFQKIFDCTQTRFHSLDISLVLKEVKSKKPTILIIGQPHSIELEIEIIKILQNSDNFDIYVKPHPLFPIDIYKRINDIILIEDKSFFPKVDIALSYESTLGLEYESSGVDVIWYKNLSTKSIITTITNILLEKDRNNNVQK